MPQSSFFRIGLFLVAALLIAAGPAAAEPAFPGAVGYASDITGGMPTDSESTDVIEVTNLKASGPGSLKSALEAQGRRLIVFEVGGVIGLGGPDGVSRLRIENPNDTATFIVIAKNDDATLGRFFSGETGNAPSLVVEYEPVPEPGAAALMGLGAMGVLAKRMR